MNAQQKHTYRQGEKTESQQDACVADERKNPHNATAMEKVCHFDKSLITLGAFLRSSLLSARLDIGKICNPGTKKVTYWLD